VQKLEVNTVVTLELPRSTPYGAKTYGQRYFIESYNADQRSYQAIGLGTKNYAKTTVIRDKAIISVIGAEKVNPDLSKWPVKDIIPYLTHEKNIISATNIRKNTMDMFGGFCARWQEYVQVLQNLKAAPGKDRLLEALDARKQFFASRLVATHQAKKSRTVMRRLRKKNVMRNSNSSTSKKKTTARYMTSGDARRKNTVCEPGISTKPLKKSRKTKLKAPAQATGTIDAASAIDDTGAIDYKVLAELTKKIQKTSALMAQQKKKSTIPYF
jgi:hypothetical protein